MKKNNIILTIIFLTLSNFLCIPLISSIVMICHGEINKKVLIIGIFSSVVLLMYFVVFYTFESSVQKYYNVNKIYEYYVSLVDLAESNPKLFNKKYKCLMGIGDKYILVLYIMTIYTIIVMITIGSFGKLMVAFGLIIAVLLCILTKTFYIRPEYIEGFLVTEDKYPCIFRTINSAREKTGAQKLQKVYICSGANCAVFKNAIGFGLRNENIIAIGIYLLRFLTSDELESILIHEFAHIYKNDTAISYKISRNIIKWNMYLEKFERKGVARALFCKYAEKYIFTMNMYSSAISKHKETFADMEAAKYTSKDTYAAASMKLEMIEYYFNQPIQENQIDLRSYKEAPKDFYNLLINEFLKNYDTEGEKWKNQILKKISNKFNAHPSYKERMEKIGVIDFDFKIDFYVKTSIISEVNEIINIFNNVWYNSQKENWDEYRDEYKKLQEIISDFKLSDDNDKNMEYGIALENLTKFDEALAFYSFLLEKQYDNAPALYRTGVILLNRNDENGIEFIKKAIEINNGFIDEGLTLIRNYLELNGYFDKREEMREWALQKAEIYRAKLYEVNNIYTDDKFVEAELTSDQRQLLKKNLSEIPSVKIALIVTKELQYSKDNLLVVGIISKQKIFNVLTKTMEIQDTDLIVQAIRELKIPYFLLDLNESPQFRNPLTLVKNSELLRR